MTGLNPTHLLRIVEHGSPPTLQGLLEWCRCTRCGGSKRGRRYYCTEWEQFIDDPVTSPHNCREGNHEPTECRRCEDTDGWDPDRVWWLTDHFTIPQLTDRPTCDGPQERNDFHDGCGWVPRIGVLP